ncbi:MAG: helix-turn-helix domain-containing protein [Sphingomonadales bacterium]
MPKRYADIEPIPADPDDPDEFDVPAEIVRIGLIARDFRLLRKQTLKLSQEAFARRYSIPVGTLRDWEQGRSMPSETMLAFMELILDDPEKTAAVLDRDVA